MRKILKGASYIVCCIMVSMKTGLLDKITSICKITWMTLHAFSMYPLILMQIISIELRSKKNNEPDKV